MTRRDFLARLGLAAGAVALSPLLDLSPIEPVVAETIYYEPYAATIIWIYNLSIHNPRRLGVISSIS